MSRDDVIPVIFDWNDNEVIGEAIHKDGVVTIVISEQQILDHLTKNLDSGTIVAVAVGFKIRYDITYAPGDIDGT